MWNGSPPSWCLVANTPPHMYPPVLSIYDLPPLKLSQYRTCDFCQIIEPDIFDWRGVYLAACWAITPMAQKPVHRGNDNGVMLDGHVRQFNTQFFLDYGGAMGPPNGLYYSQGYPFVRP
jgi:hypothetical protein